MKRLLLRWSACLDCLDVIERSTKHCRYAATAAAGKSEEDGSEAGACIRAGLSLSGDSPFDSHLLLCNA